MHESGWVLGRWLEVREMRDEMFLWIGSLQVKKKLGLSIAVPLPRTTVHNFSRFGIVWGPGDRGGLLLFGYGDV